MFPGCKVFRMTRGLCVKLRVRMALSLTIPQSRRLLAGNCELYIRDCLFTFAILKWVYIDTKLCIAVKRDLCSSAPKLYNLMIMWEFAECECNDLIGVWVVPIKSSCREWPAAPVACPVMISQDILSSFCSGFHNWICFTRSFAFPYSKAGTYKLLSVLH